MLKEYLLQCISQTSHPPHPIHQPQRQDDDLKIKEGTLL